MHFYQAPGGTDFNYHGDFSGDVEIIGRYGASVEVPAADLLAFAAEFVRQAHIAALEDAEPMDVLLGTVRPRNAAQRQERAAAGGQE